MIFSILVFFLVLVSILLIGVILVQSGQGDMGSAMGGNTMNQAFGSDGADKLLVRITGGLAFAFMFLAIMISLYPISENTDIDNPVLARNKGKEVELVVPSDIESIDQEDSQSGE